MTRAVLPLVTLTLIGEREHYGYEIVERLESEGLEVSAGLIYPVLGRLERDGLVATRSVSSSAGPPRKYFALTSAGLDTLASARDQWQRVAFVVHGILATEGTRHE